MRTSVAVLLFFAATHARAEARQKVAVLELDVAKGLHLDRTYFSDKVRGSIQNRAPQLFVMTRESTEMLLQQSGTTLADCSGQCEVETGRKLGADFVVSGRLTKVGSRFALTLRLHGTATGELIKTGEALGKDADALVDQTDAAVAKLLGHSVKTPPPPVRETLGREVETVRDDERKAELTTGIRFVSIPAGTFLFHGYSRITRKLRIKAFWMGETDVTVVSYAKCVNTGRCSRPDTGNGCNWNTGRDDHPINCVDWNQASAFCKWAGARLPTEQEWEYVASGGSEGRTYPWGNDEPRERACWNGKGNGMEEGARKTTCPVGTHRMGDSRWGVQDVVGSVWQWTSSGYEVGSKCVRGGAFYERFPEELASDASIARPSSWRDYGVGFRCAL